MYRLSIIRQKLLKNDLIRHNFIFFVGTMGIAAFNYLYYPVVSRLVSVQDFGEIQAVISIFMQLGIVLTAFGYVITHLVTNARNHKESNGLILHLEQIMLMISIIGLPFLLAIAYISKDSFKLHSIIPVLLVGILILINIPATSRSYILQGLKKLGAVSIGGVVYAVGKLLLTAGLIYLLTDDVMAAVCGYIIAQVLTLGYLQSRLKGEYVSILATFSPVKFHKLTKSQRRLINNELVYGVVVTAILAGLTLLYSSDTILARLFFDPHTLGIYSGISSIARIVFFVTASVAGVLIASIKIGAKAQDNRRILVRSVGIISLIGGAVVVTFAAFPDFFVSLLLGSNYTSGSRWLPMLALVMLVCSLNNLLAIYQIALRRYRTVITVVIGIAVLLIGLWCYHDSIEHFITVLLVSNLVVGVLLSIEIALEKRGRVSGQGTPVGRIAEL